MSKPHKNNPNDFSEFNLNQLERYARKWVKKYSVIQIERIILYRLDTEAVEGLQEWLTREVSITKYALVFEFSGCEHINFKTGKTDLEIKPYNEKCKVALRGILYADQLASQGTHQLFDDFFPKTVYDKKNMPTDDYYKNWTTILKRPDEPLPTYILTDEPHWILYPVSGVSDDLQHSENTETVPNFEYFRPEIINLMNEVRPEIELIYKAVKEGEGFNDIGKQYDKSRMNDALCYFEECEDMFKIIKKEDLQNIEIFRTVAQKNTRKIKGELLRNIVTRRNLGLYAYSKLFNEYQKQKK
jgi:hypothetical protein